MTVFYILNGDLAERVVVYFKALIFAVARGIKIFDKRLLTVEGSTFKFAIFLTQKRTSTFRTSLSVACTSKNLS
jgi:hypothetical protein